MKNIYLNLGCGTVKLNGFCNIDIVEAADLVHDINQGLPFDDDSVSGIYSEHFIEHLTQPQIIRLLRECRRVLRVGGRLRIATPDLDELVRQAYFDDWRQPWLDKYGYQWISNRAEYLNICMREWGHQYLLNEEELRRLGCIAGFDECSRYKLGISNDPTLSGLETRSESTLILEFVKSDKILDKKPSVSVVIPAYSAKYFSECLNSVLRQDYLIHEILVGDDGKNDDLAQICHQAKNSGFPVHYIRNEKQLGEVDNFTALIHLASGELIKPLHDDDILEHDAVTRLVNALVNSPGATLAVGPRYLINELGEQIPVFSMPYGKPLGEIDRILPGPSVAAQMLSLCANFVGEPSCMLFRRSDALAWSEPNVMSLFGRTCYGAGDVALAVRLLSRGDLAYTGKFVAAVRRHPEQTQAKSETKAIGVQTWAYMRQHGVRLGLLDNNFQPITI